MMRNERKPVFILLSSPLEQECAVLRDELDVQHKKRLEALEIKIKPIIIKDGPSKKVI